MCICVYDANSNLKTYVDSYKTYLEGKGATIKSARLMTLEESYAFSNENLAAWKETSYWLGSAYDARGVWGVFSHADFYNNDYYDVGKSEHEVRLGYSNSCENCIPSSNLGKF